MCFGCRYGETPGERIQIKLKDAYYKTKESRMKIEKNPSPCAQAKLYKLERGSLYGTGMFWCVCEGLYATGNYSTLYSCSLIYLYPSL